MSHYIIDPETRTATETPEYFKDMASAYVQELGATIPTLNSTPMSDLVNSHCFCLFTYSGSPTSLRAHIRTALLHNLTNHLDGDFPTWRALGLDGILDAIFRREEDQKAGTLDADILFLMVPEAHTSEKIQDVLDRHISGRNVMGRTTILCTRATLPWFEGKSYSEEFHTRVTEAPEAQAGPICARDVRRWNGCPKGKL